MPFEWDDAKATANIVNHFVSFEEAETAFDDPYAVLLDDAFHSSDETRNLLIGHSYQGRLLFVCYTERNDNTRLISARLATNREREKYEE